MTFSEEPYGEPPISTQAELHQLWSDLFPPGAFDSVSLWLMPIDEYDVPLQQLIEIAELPTFPPRSFHPLIDPLVDGLAGTQVAFLLARPGSLQVTDLDADWARGLIQAAQAAGLGGWPVHLATDHGVVVVPPDAWCAAG